MLSITKINSASNQAKKGHAGEGYIHYLGGPATSTKTRGDFDGYARGKEDPGGPAPFWAGQGASRLGLDGFPEAEHVERLARGFHPLTGEPLVKGAGERHVMGLDMTFSAPKDVSAVYAGGDAATRDAVVDCVQQAARAALDFTESHAITRHGAGGQIKKIADAAIACLYTHMSSRAGEPQLHVHALLFNLGKREGVDEWSALEQRAQFERTKATGILFRAELAIRMKSLGFGVEADGPYFKVRGITQAQRDALSTRSKQIAQYVKECGMEGADRSRAREVAALNTRAAKAEPPLPELLADFSRQAEAIGLTPESVRAMRNAPALIEAAEPFALDHAELMERLMERQSCATSSDALAMICEMAMGRWTAAECLAELARFLRCELAVPLGRTETLAEVFTSKATLAMETSCSEAVADGAGDERHRLAPEAIDRQFDELEAEISAKLGAPASLAQQRAAAMHVAAETGRHAFVEGWAGTGKTTMLKALGEAYKASGFAVAGCCQSAAASQNLARETGIPSRTIASLLHSIEKGKAKLGPRTILFLDEAGMVGSREFFLLQKAALDAGAKLVAVGDPKQLQPIDAGGIFRALVERHGKAEISNIQRQRTDFGPLVDWLRARGDLSTPRARALARLPEDARLGALEALCAEEPKLARGFERWRERFDHKWLREAVRKLATGEAADALRMLDERGRLRIVSGHTATIDALVAAWMADKAPLDRKTMIAGTRAEVSELNAKARAALIAEGTVRDELGIEVEIIHRDESRERKRFAPGDRVVFTKNDKALGVSNGVAGTILSIDQAAYTPLLRVELDDPNERGESLAMVPPSFGRFDSAWCLTNHKGQGRTFDSAHVLANPSMCDREWAYVAASRSRFSTTIYANQGALLPPDVESHDAGEPKPADRESMVAALARAMSRSRSKDTSLDRWDALALEAASEADADREADAIAPLPAEVVPAATGAVTRLFAKILSIARRQARPFDMPGPAQASREAPR